MGKPNPSHTTAQLEEMFDKWETSARTVLSNVRDVLLVGLSDFSLRSLAASLNHALHDEIVDGKVWRYTGKMIPIQAPLEALLSTIIDPDSGTNKQKRYVDFWRGS